MIAITALGAILALMLKLENNATRPWLSGRFFFSTQTTARLWLLAKNKNACAKLGALCDMLLSKLLNGELSFAQTLPEVYQPDTQTV